MKIYSWGCTEGVVPGKELKALSLQTNSGVNTVQPDGGLAAECNYNSSLIRALVTIGYHPLLLASSGQGSRRFFSNAFSRDVSTETLGSLEKVNMIYHRGILSTMKLSLKIRPRKLFRESASHSRPLP